MLRRILDKQLELNDEGNPAWGSSGEYKSQESKDIDNFVDFASELAELKAKQDKLKEKKLNQMREEYHPRYLEYVGKCFKMENAYSGDRKWSEQNISNLNLAVICFLCMLPLNGIQAFYILVLLDFWVLFEIIKREIK